MSKFVLAATELDAERVVYLRPDTDPKQDPGWRFRIDKEKGEVTYFVEEQVLPEKVDSPNALRVLCTKSHTGLSKDDLKWLRDACDEILRLGGDW